MSNWNPNKYKVPVSCKDCRKVWLKVKFEIKTWDGHCYSCAAKHRSPRHFSICESCGLRFSHVASNRPRFCSFKCKTEKAQLTCQRCGVVFYVQRHRAQTASYCSRQCSWASKEKPDAMKRANQKDWRKRKRTIITCPICNTNRLVYRAPSERGKHDNCRGCMNKRPRPHKRCLSQSDALKACYLYSQGHTAQQIASHFSVTSPTITQVLKKFGIEMRRAHNTATRSVNHNAFDLITEESAYWIGFLMADGCVQRPSEQTAQVTVSLHIRDENHVIKFRSFLKSTHKIGHNKGGIMCSLSVTSKPLADALEHFGVVPRKSKTAKAIKIEGNRHFWRGVIDGDGCIGITKNQYARIELVGSKNLLEQFATFAKHITGRDVLPVQPHKSIFRVRLAGQTAKTLVAHLYDKCTVALDRKLATAQRILSQAR